MPFLTPARGRNHDRHCSIRDRRRGGCDPRSIAPDALNSFNQAMRGALLAATERARDDQAARAVVLAGAGRCFSAGADLKAGFKTGQEIEQILNEEYKPSLMNIATMEKPVISAINGFAAGIGLSYALACDLAVMGESAFLLSPFSTIGLIPDGGATWLLTQALGHRNAYQLAVDNDRVPASRCQELGLVNKVAADDALLTTAKEWAAKLAAKAPLALARTKKLMRQAPGLSYRRCHQPGSRVATSVLRQRRQQGRDRGVLGEKGTPLHRPVESTPARTNQHVKPPPAMTALPPGIPQTLRWQDGGVVSCSIRPGCPEKWSKNGNAPWNRCGIPSRASRCGARQP